MAASRAIASGLRCNACRSNFIRSFVSIAGVEIPASGLPHARATTRSFTTIPLRLSDARSRKDIQQPETELSSEELPAPSNTQDASVPWYLQVDAPGRPLDASTNPLADRQRLPDLPEHPPPILERFLQYVSVDLGIDDLSLLDLRHLDPPPALGANLLMLFGTARSEKHLHVSADRLCRWLRSEYKLSPHADGLLGRNELKLKLRRKARKARMLSNVGVSESSLAADDGIRTGWICVNAGSVKPAESAPKAVQQTEGFVGFVGQSEGVNIVLQLFTEEKRVELDLENLWNGVLKTDRRRRDAQTPPEAAEQVVDEMHNPNGAVLADQNTVKQPHQSPQAKPQAPLQARAYHTSTGRLFGTRLALERDGKHSQANTWSRTRKSPMSTRSDHGMPMKDRIAPSELKKQAKPDQHAEAIALANKLEELHQMSPKEKLEALGEGSGRDRKNLTPFLKEFYGHIPEFPDVLHYEALLQLYLTAHSLNHSGYPVFVIHDLLEEMQVAGVRVPERMFLASIRALLSVEHPSEFNEASSRRRYQIVFALLYAMQGHSYPSLTDEVILMLHDSVSTLSSDLNARHKDAVVAKKRAAFNQSARHELLHQVDMLELPLKPETYAHLLRSYAILGDMKGMWHVWTSTALAMQPRSAQMYAIALNGVAFTGHQVNCIRALRDCLATMPQEIPPVELKDDVREAVMRCLLVVEPSVDKTWEQGVREGEWVKLWDRCMSALKKEEYGKEESSQSMLEQFRTSVLGRQSVQ
ncbi:hypothetical protein MPH_12095 [Macrophomina phaseolina MS6]|uniref:ATPase synthesis protein 25 n=1 Tax=Macrophomina phaseolina (strain MS6) TaxID=1126212 RepID=K2RKU6_MACPH|nr:hypothetical protein MPH_12095 [Macrophomina phaseolina MS6]